MKNISKIAHLVALFLTVFVAQQAFAAGRSGVGMSVEDTVPSTKPFTPTPSAPEMTKDPYEQAIAGILQLWQDYIKEIQQRNTTTARPNKQELNKLIVALGDDRVNIIQAITKINNQSINESYLSANKTLDTEIDNPSNIYYALSNLLYQISISNNKGIIYHLQWDSNKLGQYQPSQPLYPAQSQQPMQQHTQTAAQYQQWVQGQMPSQQQSQIYPQPIGPNPYAEKQAAIQADFAAAANKVQNAAAQAVDKYGQPIAQTASSIWGYGKGMYNTASQKWNEFWQWARPSEQELIYAKTQIDIYKKQQSHGIKLDAQQLQQLRIYEATVAKWWPTILGVGAVSYFIWNNPTQAWGLITGTASTAASLAKGTANLGWGVAKVAGQTGYNAASMALTTKPGLLTTGALGYGLYKSNKDTQPQPVQNQSMQPQQNYYQQSQPQNSPQQPYYIPQQQPTSVPAVSSDPAAALKPVFIPKKQVQQQNKSGLYPTLPNN